MGGSNFWTNSSNQRASENAVLAGLPTAKSGSKRWRRGHGCLAHQAPRMVDVVSLGGLCGLKRDTDSELPLGRGAHEIPPVHPVPVVSRRARLHELERVCAKHQRRLDQIETRLPPRHGEATTGPRTRYPPRAARTIINPSYAVDDNAPGGINATMAFDRTLSFA